MKISIDSMMKHLVKNTKKLNEVTDYLFDLLERQSLFQASEYYSDLKKWNSKIVKDYYVFATPTMFLLNNKRQIILPPSSAKQMDAWVGGR